MAGYTMSAVPKRTVDFAGLGAGLTQQLILADRVDLLQWREVTMLVNVYNHSLASGAGTLRIIAFGQSISADDPSLDFIDSTNFFAVSLNSATPSPAYIPLGDLFHPMVRVVAEGTRTGTGALNVTVGVDFSVKDA